MCVSVFVCIRKSSTLYSVHVSEGSLQTAREILLSAVSLTYRQSMWYIPLPCKTRGAYWYSSEMTVVKVTITFFKIRYEAYFTGWNTYLILQTCSETPDFMGGGGSFYWRNSCCYFAKRPGCDWLLDIHF